MNLCSSACTKEQGEQLTSSGNAPGWKSGRGGDFDVLLREGFYRLEIAGDEASGAFSFSMRAAGE